MVAETLPAAQKAIRLLFADAHNAGFYINAYTTKANTSMNKVLTALMEGITRLRHRWESEESRRAKEQDRRVEEVPQTGEFASFDKAATKATEDMRQAYTKTIQVLTKMETAFRRATWRSGAELVFPMLFHHMSFQTHRCWTVYMKAATFMAAEAWRQEYNQISATIGMPESHEVSIAQLPMPGRSKLVDGWHQESRGDEMVYIAPDGTEMDAIEYASRMMGTEGTSVGDTLPVVDAFKHTNRTALRAMRNIAEQFLPGSSKEEDVPPERTGEHEQTMEPKATTQTKPASAKMGASSQLEDYMYRGDHPIVAKMSFYVYSEWVYRVESKVYQAGDASSSSSTKRFVDIPFHPDYPHRETFVQRLAEQPRVPNPSNMKYYHPVIEEEHNAMMKGILFSPIHLAERTDQFEHKQQRITKSFRCLCTDTSGRETWPAVGLNGSTGPFRRAWRISMMKQTVDARRARAKDYRSARLPSLWNTLEVKTYLDEHGSVTGAEEVSKHVRRRPSDLLYPTVEEYCAGVNMKSAANYDGIAEASKEKPKSRLHDDRNIPEDNVVMRTSDCLHEAGANFTGPWWDRLCMWVEFSQEVHRDRVLCTYVYDSYICEYVVISR